MYLVKLYFKGRFHSEKKRKTLTHSHAIVKLLKNLKVYQKVELHYESEW